MDRVQNQSKVSMFIQRYYPTIELTLGDIGFMTLGPGLVNKEGEKKRSNRTATVVEQRNLWKLNIQWAYPNFQMQSKAKTTVYYQSFDLFLYAL